MKAICLKMTVTLSTLNCRIHLLLRYSHVVQLLFLLQFWWYQYPFNVNFAYFVCVVSIVSICSEISCCYDYLCCHLFTFMLSEISSSSDKKAAGRWREPAGDELWEVSILIISFVVSIKTNVTMIFGFYAPLRTATPTVSVHFLCHIVKMN